jgi:hypothetical protein
LYVNAPCDQTTRAKRYTRYTTASTVDNATTFDPGISILCNIGMIKEIIYAGIVRASLLCNPIHLNISKRQITETMATAIEKTHVPEKMRIGTRTQTAISEVIILFNITIPFKLHQNVSDAF